MPNPLELHVLTSAEELFQAAAAQFVALAESAVRANGRFTVALAGGSTPKSLYQLLAGRSDTAWDKTFFFFGDERHVPPDHPDSNYRMAYLAMLSKVPPENVFRVRAEGKDAVSVATAYE